MIADHHVEMLARSGITPDWAASRGYDTITDKKQLAGIGITPAGRRVPGLLVPLLDVRGSVWGYQFRPDQPRMMANGRIVKYETPTDQRNGLDVPRGVGPMLADPAIPLFVTEGSKKCDCAAAHGLCCVALLGVWSWRGTNTKGGKTALPDWQDVALNGRRVVLSYDGDVQRKESVRVAMDALAKYLAIKGARIDYLHLPDVDDAKVGLDDFLVSDGHTVADLWTLVQPIAPRPRDPRDYIKKPPKAPPPYGSIDGAALLDDVRTWFRRFICVVDPGDYDILTLWAAHTYLATELFTTPRLLIDSPIHESGKTTALDHLERLCLRPLQAAQLSSPALIPRILETSLRTILLDEVNRSLRKDKPGVEDLFSILNSGYRRGTTRPVLVQVSGGNWEPKEMPTFAPLAMAGNAPNLPDDTMSRTLRILMMPDLDDVSEESDWEHIEDDAHKLAGRLTDWTDSIRERIKQTTVELPKGCTRRARERWRPLKRIAVMAGGGWPPVADELIVRNLAEEAAEREAGLKTRPPGMALLTDLYKVWPDGERFVPTLDLVGRLIVHDPDYWGADSPYGKELTEHRFGRMLSQAAKVTSTRPGGSASPRGFTRSQLESIWHRLGIAPMRSDQSGPSGQTGSERPDRPGSGPL